ncbi:bifunctional UDP-sugar hydrolase/5'-nucleotidase [Lysinibacillus sp. F5]|uniref:bifunctional metallophosphatase/5'-nucleotidase n=1 Tax=Lysinibacillus sp. F5 TaxID=1700846 RepID=UPI00073894EA|nr:5'-nucleotidase C-terminal domain-containing protein [Lysinibacillus sp. F5]KUF29546.1 2', 3'-cyclic nucleotide 2'-phosphodiesterase [Lysinibacillus sp. F5]
MHSNDTHANLSNIAKKVTAVKEVRKNKPNALLLDAGDVFSGTLYFNQFKGQADLAFMNLMGYDVMTFGNHEFDLGSTSDGHQALVDFIKGAQFPFVSSNVDFSNDAKFTGLFTDLISSEPQKGKIYNGIIKEINGEKVGIFGLTTAETKDISSPGSIAFEDYIIEAKKAVKTFEDKGVNKIIALTHIGYDDNPKYDNDLTLAKAVEGIDIIVGGHSHTQLDKPIVIDKNTAGQAKDATLIVQAYQYNDFLGTLDVTFNQKGAVIEHNGALLKVADYAEDAKALEMLEPYKKEVDKVSNTETGAIVEVTLENPRTGGDNSKPSVRKNETLLGNVITDGMLAKARQYNNEVIMALQNGGGIRAPIDQGAITVGEVINVLPFGNTLAIMTLSGKELKQAFEISVGQYPLENGGFLHVSGAKIEFDSSKAVGQRIVKISYKDDKGKFVEIQDDVNYTIATNAFTAKGGDGYIVFKKAYEEGRVTDLGLSDWENLTDHVKSLGTFKPEIEGRILDVANSQTPEENIPESEFSGTTNSPKVYEGSVTVIINNISSLENAIVKGNLIIEGTVNGDLSFLNVQVEGNLDLSKIDSDKVNIDGVTVNGETIL